MTGKELVKEVMTLRKWSQAKLAEEMGKSQTNVTGYLNRGTKEMRLDIFYEMLHTMGCEIIIRDKMGTGKEWVVNIPPSED